MSTEKRNMDTLTVVVGGHPVEVKANENQEISTIISAALREADQKGRAAEDWDLRADQSHDAQPLDPKKKLRDYGLTLSSVLFLGLGNGGGGAW